MCPTYNNSIFLQVRSVDLKNCTKEMVVEYHNKTVYECRNVTKRHCTTLWTINDIGEKIWTGDNVINNVLIIN